MRWIKQAERPIDQETRQRMAKIHKVYSTFAAVKMQLDMIGDAELIDQHVDEALVELKNLYEKLRAKLSETERELANVD